jgi:hypothetical protein
MGINLDAIRGRLNKLQNSTSKGVEQWKPAPGKHQVRLVPYKFNKDNPFIELLFHYGINNKTYLSPVSFGRPDPIVEFAEKLKRMGDKDDWKAAQKMSPKLRTFVPVLVRGEEAEGVRFWGFGKTVYQEILGYISDPDYGDISDPETGRDIVVEVVSAEDSGTSYPVTTIRVKPKETLLSDDADSMAKFLDNQKDITTVYQELSYAEMKSVLEGWLNPTAAADTDDEVTASVAELAKPTQKASTPTDVNPFEDQPKKQSAPAPTSSKIGDVTAAFDDLFNS